MRRTAIVLTLTLATFLTVAWGETPTSAHGTAVDHIYLGYPGSYSGSMIDQSPLMACPVSSGWNSITYAATQWDSIAFGPNGYVPFYTWNGTSCNQVMSNSWPVYWKDFSQPTCNPDCYLGITYDYGVRYVGGYGLCGQGNSFCVNATRSDIFMNAHSSAGQNPPTQRTRQTATHELGHPVGLGDYAGACDLNDRSIMYYKCMDDYGQMVPGPHDVSDIAVIY